MIWNQLDAALGLGDDSLELWQMCLRAAVVYVLAILIVRIGDKRFIGKHTALDVTLGIMLGSVLSRAITGNSPFVPTLAAGLALLLLHSAMAVLAFYWSRFGTWVKGRDRPLVEDGRILWKAMRASQLTENDLMAALRNTGGITDVAQMRRAPLERNGRISVIPVQRMPRIVDVEVQEGVQTVRLRLE
ncbi:MAG TPA: YetF domain-containing protein [Pseudoxanthomonas sp.]|nr:YetF domain-containing protein [Pseudoxanthomonas sp.]